MASGFKYDQFQLDSFAAIDAGYSVFVNASTSSGKSAVAEYAMRKAVENGTRSVYTAPIKALSNQKYDEFRRGGMDVGILTGDNQLNTEAMCLVMTTEILLQQTFSNPETLADVEFVIMDEVHYFSDAERGTVWELVIMLLPKHIKLVCLSATAPNAAVFADWVTQVRKTEMRVITKLRRPVPLNHLVFISGKPLQLEEYIAQRQSPRITKSKLEEAEDRKRVVRAQWIAKGGSAGQSHKDKPKTPSMHTYTTISQNLSDLFSHLSSAEKLPAILFTFSKTGCDALAERCAASRFFIPERAARAQAEQFWTSAVKSLGSSVENIAQLRAVKAMVDAGVGVHHSGLLPFIKELVEMLFCRQLLKVLVCTETFAMGINAPARCVVFTSLKKFDGDGNRFLSAAEYTQMGGRAGRRGLDTQGDVIIAATELPDASNLVSYARCMGAPLKSALTVDFNTILRILSNSDRDVLSTIRCSFDEFKLRYKVCELQQLRHDLSRAPLDSYERIKVRLSGAVPSKKQVMSAAGKEGIAQAKNGDLITGYALSNTEILQDVNSIRSITDVQRWLWLSETPAVRKKDMFESSDEYARLFAACSNPQHDLVDYRTFESMKAAVGKLEREISDDFLREKYSIDARLTKLQVLGYLDGSSLTKKGRASLMVSNTKHPILLIEILLQDSLFSSETSSVEVACTLTAFLQSDQGAGSSKDIGDFKGVAAAVQLYERLDLGWPELTINDFMLNAVRLWVDQPQSTLDDVSELDVQLGLFARVLLSLDKLCSDVLSVLDYFGMTKGVELLNTTVKLIKRGPVFADSFYIKARM